MQIALAQPADIPAWLDLAAEVEPLFGPMVADPGFHAALERNIARQTAFCIREQDGAPSRPLMGALLFSATHAPHYTIGWLAVAQRWQRQGVAHMLVEHCFRLVQSPAELSVVTFGADNMQSIETLAERGCFPGGQQASQLSIMGRGWCMISACAPDLPAL